MLNFFCRMNLFKLKAICDDPEELIKHLTEWRLIPAATDYNCPNCGHLLYLTSDTNRPDGFQWKCRNVISPNKSKRRQCGNRISFRKGTFFERSKLSILQVNV